AKNPSAYLDAIPTRPVIHIQNRAPGPPMWMAVATPTILPVPTVAANAVASASYWVMSAVPSAPASLRSMIPSRNAEPSVRNCMPRNLRVKYKPVSKSSGISRYGPQTTELTSEKKSVSASMNVPKGEVDHLCEQDAHRR